MKKQLFLMTGALLATLSSTHAAPIFTTSFGGNNCTGNGQQTTSSTPIASSVTVICSNNPLLVASATVAAGPGSLGVSASAINNDGRGNGANGGAFAEMMSNFTILGPVGGPTSIPISLNLSLSGSATVTGVSSGWFLNLNARQFGQGSVSSLVAGTGLLSTIPSGGSILVATTITTPTVMFSVGPTHILEVSISTAVNAGRVGTAESDFAHTLSFPVSGPVFNLPAGYTIDSPDLNIFNNQFISPGASVPEPSSMALLGGGLIVAALLRSRTRPISARNRPASTLLEPRF